MAKPRTASNKSSTDSALLQLRGFGLMYPGAHTKSPWPGHLDLAVKDKTFAYLSLEGEPLSISCKLPQSCVAALMLPFTKPTGYGLGKSGWVTADFAEGDTPPVQMLEAWIDESYRAQAPKKLIAQLDAGKIAPHAASKTAETKAAAKKKATAKAKAPADTKAAAKKKTPAAKKTTAKKTTAAKKKTPAAKATAR